MLRFLPCSGKLFTTLDVRPKVSPVFPPHRVRKPGDVRASQKRADRLSLVWLRRGERLGNTPEDAGVRWVRVADREADLYEYLCDCQVRGHGFVVRAAYERVLLDVQTDQCNAQDLLSFARMLPVLGKFTLPLRARPGVAAVWRA